ncbi:uncharacterized protein LOC114263391 [Camellia sinensis]|nr:uncharacterized protein LOC114263391 [Camellia sinensis]
MASPTIQISPIPSSSPLQRLSTFKDRTTTTATPASAAGTITSPPSSIPFSSSPLDSLFSDLIFSVFFSSDFDFTRFSSTTFSSSSATARTEKLQDGVRLPEKQLCSEVLSSHDDLLSQLSSLCDAESAVSGLRSAITTLQSFARRVLSEIADPNHQIRSKTLQLSNLHRTTELLQFTICILCQSKKFRDVMAAGESEPEKLDLAKAAQLHCEILSLCNENEGVR